MYKKLEYGDREGMILLSELSRRRIRSVQKLIRVGRDEVVVVLRVDEEKGNIVCLRTRTRVCACALPNYRLMCIYSTYRLH